MTTPTLRQLEIFAQMVASGNILDCALELGMPADTIENDLRALEMRLGHQLFTIDGARVRLTAAGRKTVDAMAMLSKIESDQWSDAQAPAEPSPPESASPEWMSPEIYDAETLAAEPPCSPTITEESAYAIEPELVASQSVETDLPEREISQVAEEPAAPHSVAATEEDKNSASAELSISPVNTLSEALPPHADRDDTPFELVDIVEAEEAILDSDTSAPEAEIVDEVEPVAEGIEQENEALSAHAEPRLAERAPILPIELALRVVFKSPAPATYPPPIVISLFPPPPVAHGAEPEPIFEPQPVYESKLFARPEPPPVLELVNVAQQQVTVAAHPSVFGHFQDALTAFEQANPDVSIALELDAFTATRAEPLLASGKVDIVYYYAMGERERFESRYVWSERLSLFIGTRHVLAKKEEVTVDDLMRIRPVLLGSRNGLRPVLDNAMQRAGMDLWEPALETDNLFDIMKAVRNGAGYFAAFGPLARDFGKMEGIRRLPFVDFLPPVEVRQAVRADAREDPVVASLAEYLFR
jgi:DNA-binding transcriptional LysR family regulator